MADDKNKVGIECKLYYETTGTPFDTPAWAEITRAIDVTATVDFNTATFASRVSEWETTSFGTKTLEVTFGYEHFAGTDAVRDALIGFFTNKSVRRYLVLDGAMSTVGTQGWDFFGALGGPTVNQPLQDGMTMDFTIRAARMTNLSGVIVDPYWYTVT